MALSHMALGLLQQTQCYSSAMRPPAPALSMRSFLPLFSSLFERFPVPVNTEVTEVTEQE
jgi:hypothetical protein